MTGTVTAGAQPRTSRTLAQAIFSQTGAAFGYTAAALAVLVGWWFRDALPIDAGEGIGYALGIIGGSLMLILLLYTIRKRIRFLRRLGKIKYWFRIHMMLGVIGPLLILYHCGFDIGSLNSTVALYCTLLVAVSGLIGRYLYAKIHEGLYGSKASLASLTEQLEQSNRQLDGNRGLIDDVRRHLVEVGHAAMERPDTLAQSFTRPISLGIRTRWLYHRLSWTARRELTARAQTSPAVDENRERLIESTQRFLKQHLASVRRVAQYGFYERLFSWWHIIHVPFFLMMILSGVVHVLAVHMY